MVDESTIEINEVLFMETFVTNMIKKLLTKNQDGNPLTEITLTLKDDAFDTTMKRTYIRDENGTVTIVDSTMRDTEWQYFAQMVEVYNSEGKLTSDSINYNWTGEMLTPLVSRCLKKKSPPHLGMLSQRPGGYAEYKILQFSIGVNCSQ